MNLAEALDVLPEITRPAKRKRLFKFDSRIVGREHVEEGGVVVLAHVPGSTRIFRFSPEQWKLVHLFDGERSFEGISQLFSEQEHIQLGPADIREYAEQLEEADFWYKSPQEQNIALMQKVQERRKKHKKAKAGDLARIEVAHWDADRAMTLWHEKVRFIYTPWFTALTLGLFTFMTYVFIAHWGEIGSDTWKYYTFTEKSLADLGEFWMLFLVLAFFHESAHGLSCKHYGGGVHSMGFHLIYLTPAFFVDVTEAWVYADRFERVVTMIAGIWTELIICAIGTALWWGTPPGGLVHDLAYKIMLITGVAVVLMNMNPLIKLDGYYVMSELTGIDEIKERSTAYVSGWVKRHIFGLPLEVDYVSPRRRWFFVPYALLSGAYSYLLLFAVARFTGNVFHRYNPQWAFVPTLLVALLIFKSRIRKLVRFMHTVYLDNPEGVRAWLTPVRTVCVILAVFIVLCIPFWRERVEGRFVLEPVTRAVVRTEVPGRVEEVFVREGQAVTAHAPLLRLRNRELESQAARITADVQLGRARAVNAELQYSEFGPAEEERRQLQERGNLLQSELTKLQLESPINGVVVSPRLSDLLGTSLAAGTPAVEIADISTLRARIFVPEAAMRDVRTGEPVRLHFDSRFWSMSGVVSAIAPVSSTMEPGLEHRPEYKGLSGISYYMVSVLGANRDGQLMYGMTGTAKIFTRQRSLLGMGLRSIYDFVGRKIW